MAIPDKPDYTHGSTGTKPANGTDYQNRDPLPSEELDWLFNTPIEKTKAIISYLNDVDSDGDGKVDAAETADTATDTTTVKGNDIDSDGDGKVNSAEQADNATTVKGNDIDSDGDGKVDSAEQADTADQADNATTVKGNDIDSDGDGKVDAADVADNGAPTGGIMMWSGTTTDVPSGWTLCDGTDPRSNSDAVPDLRDRFIAGAGDQYAVGDTGGEDEHQLTVAEMPSHDHDHDRASNFNSQEGNNAIYDGAESLTQDTTSTTGGDEAHENRPPYYALAFIYKL